MLPCWSCICCFMYFMRSHHHPVMTQWDRLLQNMICKEDLRFVSYNGHLVYVLYCVVFVWCFLIFMALAVSHQSHMCLLELCDPTIQQPGFDLPRQQWSLLNRFRTELGHCGACRRKWRLTDTNLCPCGETQTMSHIVESCPLTKLNGGLSRLHSADEDAVSWLTNYG